MFILPIQGTPALLDIMKFLLSLLLNVMIYCTENHGFEIVISIAVTMQTFILWQNLEIAVAVAQSSKSFRMRTQFTTMLKKSIALCL
jgi:hypothetical protein